MYLFGAPKQPTHSQQLVKYEISTEAGYMKIMRQANLFSRDLMSQAVSCKKLKPRKRQRCQRRLRSNRMLTRRRK